MANRRFAVHEIRHVIARMRLGESDRQIATAGLMGRAKAGKACYHDPEVQRAYAEMGQPDHQGVQRVMRAAPRPEPVGEAQKILLVNG